MKTNSEKIKYINNYFSSYENDIKNFNKLGLFDDAKFYETFASSILALYFNMTFQNLNELKSTYPYVDLLSEDKKYVQVTTCKDVPTKIRETLNNIAKSKYEWAKNIKEVYFYALKNESINKIKESLTIGNVTFTKTKNLITSDTILKKAKNDLDFLNKLYSFLTEKNKLVNTDFGKFMDSIKYDSKALLEDIDEYIDTNFHIDLSTYINKINNSQYKFLLIYGEPGAGKSVLCKKILETKKNVLCIRSERLCEVDDVNKIWGFNIENVFNLVKEDIYIYIDGLEYISDIPTKCDLLSGFLKRIDKIDKAHLLCSCRTSELALFTKIFKKYKKVQYCEIEPVNIEQLKKISKEKPILAKFIKNPKYKPLLRTPFYINNLIACGNDDSVNGLSKLRLKIWNDIICLKEPNKFAKMITNIVRERATNFLLYVDTTKYKNNLINELCKYNILIKNEKGVRLKNDIFEDICFEQYIDNLFNESKCEYSSFFKKLEKLGKCIYRRYQMWIEDKLFSKVNRKNFLYKIVSNESIPKFWRKESIKGIIKSTYSKDFFNEYELKIAKNIKEFIDITNLYGFEIDAVSFCSNTLVYKLKGCGRESLIKIICENNIFRNNSENTESIKQLIFDYANSPTDDQISKYSYKILTYYINKALKQEYSYELIENEVRAIYKLYKVSDRWIKLFFKELKKTILDENKFKFANNAISDILSENCSILLEKYSKYVMDFFKVFYTTIKSTVSTTLSLYLNEHEKLFGLNDNAFNYQHDDGKYIVSFINLLKKKFWITFDWYLDFVNERVSIYKTNNNINTYKIYFSKDNVKEYFGTMDMWKTGECSLTNMPMLLSDMTFIVKYITKKYIENSYGKDKSKFAKKIKGMIYKKSNNIIGLSIISNIGLTFWKELPGYCLELISSLEIVSYDLIRDSDVKIRLPILKAFNYNDIDPKNNLRNYAQFFQLNYPKLRKKIFDIFDYLYKSVADPNHLLQLQYMDIIRRCKIKQIDSKTISIESHLTGEQKNIHDEAMAINEKIFTPINEYKKILNSLKNKTPSINKIDQLISIFNNYKKDLMLQTLYINELFTYISDILKNNKLKLSDKKRNEYCLFWIEYAQRCFSFDSVHIKAQLYENLFNQLNEKIPESTKNEIKKIILDSLNSFNKNNGLIFEIYEVAKSFLLNNPKYAHIYQNTIFALAKDEMEHQKFNYEYLCKYHKKEKIDFVPNMQPSLCNVDNYIKQDGRKQFKTKRNNIINNYLYDEAKYRCSNIDVNQCDIRIISHIFSCNLNIGNKSTKTFVSRYLKMLIEIYNKNPDDSIYIISAYETLEVEEFFKQCLLNEKTYSIALNVLFNDIDFKKFTRYTINFYLNILASMTVYYFNAYNSSKNREHVQNVINLMENYINKITNERIKKELSKSLILGYTMQNEFADWNKCKTEYRYQDKKFLNKIFSNYGYLNFYDMLKVIKKLQYKKLLPEILNSISASFEKYIKLNKINITKEIISFIREIMWYSFLTYEEEIKNDSELTKSFENILSNMIELGDKASAIILDNFRTH